MKRGYLFLLGLVAFLLGACAPRVEVPAPALPDVNTFGPTFYCGYMKGAPLPHQVFVPEGEVTLTLIGGESAAVGVEEGFVPETDPARETLVVHYPGSLDGCLFPQLSATFAPEGPFALVHVFGEEHSRVYSFDSLNEAPRGMRAYEALTPLGKKAGVLIFIEEWVDADYNDAVLLLTGADPVR